MPVIELATPIAAPCERVFDLARSIDLHTASTAGTGERAIGGVTSGLIGLGEEVTWRARHFGVWQSLSVRITAFERPAYFADAMLRGTFRRMEHHHYFEPLNLGPGMADGRSAPVIDPTRLPASRAASPSRCSRFEPESLVKPSTNPSQPSSIPGSRFNNGTIMRDVFSYESPLGLLGRFADAMFLERYMRAFLIERNRVIKATAESDDWKRFLASP